MKIAKILTINLILVIVTLLIFEVILRNFSKLQILPITQKSLYKFNKDLGWTFVPNISNFYSNPNQIGIRVNTNESGFRDKEILRDTKKKKILFIGDSMTAALQVTENERFSALLGKKLNYESYNLAVNGYATDQVLIVMKKYIAKIKPEIVFYYLVDNDFSLNGESYLTSGFGTKWSKPTLNKNFEIIHSKDIISQKHTLKTFLKEKSALIRLYVYLKIKYKKKKENHLIKFNKNQSLDKKIFKQLYFDNEEKIKKFEIFKNLLIEMKRVAENHGSILIVSRAVNIIDVDLEIQKIGQQNSVNIYNNDDIYSDYLNKIKLFFNENDIIYLPVSDYNFNQNNIKKILFYDKNNRLMDGHYTKFGHDYVTKIMYRFIKKYTE